MRYILARCFSLIPPCIFVTVLVLGNIRRAFFPDSLRLWHAGLFAEQYGCILALVSAVMGILLSALSVYSAKEEKQKRERQNFLVLSCFDLLFAAYWLLSMEAASV